MSEPLKQGGDSAAGLATTTKSEEEQFDKFDIEKLAPEEPTTTTAGFWDIFKQFVLLGWTAFGGPAAHVALFQKVFVERLSWMTSVVFLELLALGQCLPGPTSTQISFAIGVVKKGIPGGLLSGILFQYPGLLMMSLVGVGVDSLEITSWKKGISDGLAAVAVALVANAARGLAGKTCVDKVTSGISVGAAVVAYYYPEAWTFPALIVVGGLITLFTKRKDNVALPEVNEGLDALGVGVFGGAILILTWACVLGLVIGLASAIPYEDAKPLHWFESFYRTGSLIFGGGQVVLPLIINEVTQENCSLDPVTNTEVCVDSEDSWVTSDQFYLGLGIVQAMPGPLFNFSAYLGAVTAIRAGYNAVAGIASCWFGLFSPGILLIYGVLPFWGAFRKLPAYRRALPGLNAAAVGLIITAVFVMLFKVVNRSSFPSTSVGIGIIGFALVDIFKVQAPLIVVGGGVMGLIGWALDMN
ncbi:hypothetical protein BSKO_01149 [Bryopsis sp. KO-2023]|nr:hypothetical protein BSKO_01149 [Bryopsis sp. KO-2023]